MKRLSLILVLLCVSAFGQSSPYSAYSNFPQSNTFFPIAVWSQTPNRTQGGGALYGSIALAMAGTKMNILMAIDNGSGYNYPASCGTDTSNLFADIANAGLYVMPIVFPLSWSTTNGTTTISNSALYPFNSSWNGTEVVEGTSYTISSATGTTLTMTSTVPAGSLQWSWMVTNASSCSSGPYATVSSLQTIASNLGKSAYLIGYVMGDEPQGSDGCTHLIGSIPSIMTTFDAYDTTRPFTWNHTGWPFNHGSCSGSLNQNALKAMSIGSSDIYPMTSPYNGLSGTVTDSNGVGDYNWIQAWETAVFLADGNAGQPMWFFIDSGTNELGFSSQNSSTCGALTCTTSGQDPHYYRAPSEVVNAQAWATLINGGLGIEWFCDDVGNTTNYDFCLGDGGSGTEQSTATAIAQNITYIDTTILNYAKQIQSPVNGICTMNTGTSYSSHTSSCTNGILTMSTGTSAVPGSAVVKTYSGTPYLFADSDRNGSATMTFTLTGYAGYTATVVYDSNAQYDPTHSSVGNTFTLNGSGQFSDTFGANGHNYQPKIYTITNSSPSFTCSPSTLPTNHSGHIALTCTATGGLTWNGSTAFNTSGTCTYVSTSNTSSTSQTVTVTTGGSTGTCTIADTTDSVTSPVTVATATLSISPNSGNTSTTPSLTLTGANTLWNSETPSTLFSLSGGSCSGDSLATPTVGSNTSATSTLTTGSAACPITVTDNSTTATATFTVNNPVSVGVSLQDGAQISNGAIIH